MKNRYLGKVILFGIPVLACLLILQVYWFKKAFDVSEKQFDHTVQIALKKVADSVSRDSQIKKLSSNFFFVQTESELNDRNLDSLLKKEFLIRSLDVDYELGVYNADDDTLVYGNYVQSTITPVEENISSRLPGNEKNFAVYFPTKNSYITAQLGIWIFSTIILLLMVSFFAFAIYSLLKEKKFAALKNDFINNMTHEFKTPVTNIRIAGEILQNKSAAFEEMKVYIDIVLKENEKLRLKIDEVLTRSTIENQQRPILEVVDIHTLIQDCVQTFQMKIQERQGNVKYEFQASNALVFGDRILLTQAINNIIDNAEKYSVARPHIILRTRDADQAVEIVIVDEGIGIASSMRSKVFEKFFRAPSGDVHNVKGFGLGLSFVKEVIRKHRGRVSLLSELNKGTEVRILLPNV
jgi:two-component system phosphate regulon sensor histidine kinase PhoR